MNAQEVEAALTGAGLRVGPLLLDEGKVGTLLSTATSLHRPGHTVVETQQAEELSPVEGKWTRVQLLLENTPSRETQQRKSE